MLSPWRFHLLTLMTVISCIAPHNLGAEEHPAALHLRAFQQAYPARVERVAERDGDWALRVDGTWFYWAEGRMLPDKARGEWRRFASMALYEYEAGSEGRPMPAPGSEDALRILHRLPVEDRPPRHNGFYGALFGAHTAGQARRVMTHVDFLGYPLRVHPTIVAPLQRVALRLQEEMRSSPRVAGFLRTLERIDSQNWRPVAGTTSQSLHSYGIAVDLLPPGYGGGFSYWRWAATAGVEDWWLLSAQDIWMPPEEVVAAFEANGFVWGGRWLTFDTLHFEYRPDVYAFTALAQSRGSAP